MGGTITQECICCGVEDDCIEGLCLSCSEYNHKLQKQVDLLTLGLLQEKQKHPVARVTESIFHTKHITIPLADVQHVEHFNYGDNEAGRYVMVITKHTKYNFEHDTWENAICVTDHEKFLAAWCRYRHELEFNTLADIRPDTA